MVPDVARRVMSCRCVHGARNTWNPCRSATSSKAWLNSAVSPELVGDAAQLRRALP
jgi:hypothetical protein